MMTVIGYDEDSIRESVDDGSWARGLNYFHRGHIHDMLQEDDELYALCEGSRPQPYEVSVRLGPRGFEDAHCTCPIGEYGDCKHLVALMLTYLHTSQSVPEIETLFAPLRSSAPTSEPPLQYHYSGRDEVAAMSHDELVALVGRLIKADPGLVAFLPLPPLPDPAAGPADEDKMRGLIAEVIRRRVQHSVLVGDGLREFEELARAYLDAGDGYSAALVHGLLAEVLLEDAPSASLRYGNPLWQVHLKAFCEHLTRIEDSQTRSKLLWVFLSLLSVSPSTGGRKIEDLVTQAIKDTLRYDEVGDLVRQAEQLLKEPGLRLRQRARNLFGRLGLNLGQEHLPLEALVKRCLDTRQYHPLTARMVEEGALERIADLLAERGDGLPLPVLTEVLQRGWGNRLIPAVEKGLLVHLESALERAKMSGNELLPEAVVLSQLSRSGGAWQALSLATMLRGAGLWEHARSAYEARLEALTRFDLLIDLALRDKDVESALRWVDRLTAMPAEFDATFWRRRVAQAAAKNYAHEALVLYAEEAEALIAGRSRPKYQEAAEILVVMRDIYKRIKQPEVFDDYIAALRAEYARLGALQQELDRAGL